MSLPRLTVLDGYCLNPGDLSWNALERLAAVTVYERTSPADVLVRARGSELLMTNKALLPGTVLEQLPGLRYIGVLATGYNIVDVEAARRLGITVTNIPTYGTASVAQHAIALLLELAVHAGDHSRAAREGAWANSRDWCFWNAPLVELAGKTLGVIGFGRIGRTTAKIGDALGMRILAHDSVQTNPPSYDGFGWATLEEILRESDAITLHCPLTAENTGLINAARLKTMKPSAFVINTARGPLVADQDLADALNAGVIAGAGLDVLSIEPPAATNPLLTARNCIVTPHNAWATREARARLMEIAVSNVAAFLAGKPQNAV
jgi:glycerate dehydrogenase